ncbi:hypothetical protein SASPL_150762 [Salvia splendens]|uniref:Uncharacterized protein n=1 Tax=Salvia splendens TaxID=180675 RepID=A0A8X8W6K4_SALSN|nr:hypothetical protein SASPL_150762 [Salvia splendens]
MRTNCNFPRKWNHKRCCLIAMPLPYSLTSSSHATSADDELVNHGFPVGLLPAEIESYTLNHTSGAFSVRLGGNCRVTLPPDNYLATYSKRITGKIVGNRIAELDGISVRAFFKWWGITGIKSSGQDLVFEVGVLTAKYPSKNFDVSPPCQGRRSSSS